MNKQKPLVLVIIILVIFAVGTLYLLWQNDDAPDGSVTPSSSTSELGDKEVAALEEEGVMVTGGVKHTVDLDEIIGGGPAQDGIPSIDEPEFISPSEADDFLNDEEQGIAVDIDGVQRFYPFQILVWHEIVNDTINDQRVLVTYCPLCFSGIVFDPVVDGERVEFGTSGKLWQSNLVMYDRKTETYWSQVLGEGIKGEKAGELLDVLPSDQITYGDWKAANPNGEVLSKNTGALRFYGDDPYGDYYTDNNDVFFGVRNQDDRLERKDFVLGVVSGDQAKAYHPPAVKAAGEVTDEFAGMNLVLRYEEEIDAVRIFKVLDDGTEERVNPFGNFWFSWVAAHPNTELFK